MLICQKHIEIHQNFNEKNTALRFHHCTSSCQNKSKKEKKKTIKFKRTSTRQAERQTKNINAILRDSPKKTMHIIAFMMDQILSDCETNLQPDLFYSDDWTEIIKLVKLVLVIRIKVIIYRILQNSYRMLVPSVKLLSKFCKYSVWDIVCRLISHDICNPKITKWSTSRNLTALQNFHP